MRTHRFYIKQNISDAWREKNPNTQEKEWLGSSTQKITINDADLIHQWRHVLRFQVGQEVILFDGSSIECKAMIVSLTNRSAEVEIFAARFAALGSKFALTLYLGLAKRAAFEWALEKGTEIGVLSFVPVISEHSEKKTINLERSEIIVREACEQAGLAIVPAVLEPMTFAKALQMPDQSQHFSFALDPRGESFDLAVVKKRINETGTGQLKGVGIDVFVGPEGGWSPAEIEHFKVHNIPVYSLGDHILRAETAAMAIASLLLL